MPPLNCPSKDINHETDTMQWPMVMIVSSAVRRGLLAIGFRGFGLSRKAGATSGPASTTDPTQRLAVMRLCEREILIAEIRHRQRQHKATCSARAKLRRLTAELVA